MAFANFAKVVLKNVVFYKKSSVKVWDTTESRTKNAG